MVMTIPDGYHLVPAGKLAAVVTSLEMHARPPLRAEHAQPSWSLRHAERPDLGWYRALFARIGGAYLWGSRLLLDDAALGAIVHDPRVEVYALDAGGSDDGIVELDFREANACELTFFGVAARHVGTGAARWMMNRAIARAWSAPIARFWVHTCTLDHPSAPAFYVRSGFRPFRSEVEIFDDPRVLGVLPRDAAPGVPLLA
ncbi:MAG: GNAT family N-acetyltransferase [Candidatus Elarobacter sp.]